MKRRVCSVIVTSLFIVFAVPLLRLDLLKSLKGQHVIKVTFLGHLVETDHFINVANSESLVRPQDSKESYRDPHRPQYQTDCPNELPHELRCILRVDETSLPIEESYSDSTPEALDSKDEEGFLRVIHFVTQEQL